jgi:hypothetical protein
MAKFTAQSLVEDILNNPEAVKVVESLMPGITKNPAIKMVKKFTLEKLSSLPQANLSKENLEKLLKELNERVEG